MSDAVQITFIITGGTVAIAFMAMLYYLMTWDDK